MVVVTFCDYILRSTNVPCPLIELGLNSGLVMNNVQSKNASIGERIGCNRLHN